jgi:hypothetical protein
MSKKNSNSLKVDAIIDCQIIKEKNQSIIEVIISFVKRTQTEIGNDFINDIPFSDLAEKGFLISFNFNNVMYNLKLI